MREEAEIDEGVWVQLITESMCDLLSGECSERNPLLIGCSGGGGHNAAIIALAQYLRSLGIKIIKHAPMTYAQKQYSVTAVGMFAAAHLQGFTYIKFMCEFLGLPIVPDAEKLHQKILALQRNNTKERDYIDMFFDVYRTGYENVAVWDLLQCADQKDALAALVNWQAENDKLHKQDVYQYFLNALERAHADGKPHTEIISTQANGLAALCKAVHTYNQRHNSHVVIHQYMTDMPTKGAVHFFRALANLKPYQQQQMKVYAVDMRHTIWNKIFPAGDYFQSIHTLHPKRNPMVRRAFCDPLFDKSMKFHLHMDLELVIDSTLDGHTMSTINIAANTKIASIMLGSQAGNDTLRYIANLIYRGIDKVFIFASANQEIKDKISQLLHEQEQLRDHVIVLGPQDASVIAALESRSSVVIVRSGGLTVMEQMAMLHHPQQVIFIHHADSLSDTLTSGISWEDENADQLIEYLLKENIRVIKTSPNEIDFEWVKLFGDVMPQDESNALSQGWQLLS